MSTAENNTTTETTDNHNDTAMGSATLNILILQKDGDGIFNFHRSDPDRDTKVSCGTLASCLFVNYVQCYLLSNYFPLSLKVTQFVDEAEKQSKPDSGASTCHPAIGYNKFSSPAGITFHFTHGDMVIPLGGKIKKIFDDEEYEGYVLGYCPCTNHGEKPSYMVAFKDGDLEEYDEDGKDENAIYYYLEALESEVCDGEYIMSKRGLNHLYYLCTELSKTDYKSMTDLATPQKLMRYILTPLYTESLKQCGWKQDTYTDNPSLGPEPFWVAPSGFKFHYNDTGNIHLVQKLLMELQARESELTLMMWSFTNDFVTALFTGLATGKLPKNTPPKPTKRDGNFDDISRGGTSIADSSKNASGSIKKSSRKRKASTGERISARKPDDETSSSPVKPTLEQRISRLEQLMEERSD